MARSHGRTGRPWLGARARIIAQKHPCWICGHPIDYTLPYRDPYTGRINRWSVAIDHLWDGEDVTGMAALGYLEAAKLSMYHGHLHWND